MKPINNYRLYVFLIITLSLTLPANAQFVRNKKTTATANWQNKAFDTDGVYGAEVDKAHEFLKGKKPKKQVVVALIGAGIDSSQEDLAGKIGKGKLHGWNFLGTPGGETVDMISREADREFFRLKDKGYGEIVAMGGKYYKYDKEQQKRVETLPEDINEYKYYQKYVVPESQVAAAYGGMYVAQISRSYLPEFDKDLRNMFPGKAITKDDVMTYIGTKTQELEKDTLQAIAFVNVTLGFMGAGSDNWDDVLKFFAETHPPYVEAAYNDALSKTIKDDREPIGDDPYDIKDTKYGNNNLLADNAGYGTLYAGIIAANRGNEKGIDGIADRVTILPLRVEADPIGEPYMKDIALAIRYAVEHGADIIQLGKSNTIFPLNQCRWVKDALFYAESKGVLIVMPMEDHAYNLDEKPFYPNRYMDGKELTGMITVGASNEKGKPLLNANYSSRELDLFAPGEQVISLYTGNTNRVHSGSQMAASVVTGIAALIKSYYPKLNSAQIREILMKSVTDRTGTEVEKHTVLITPTEEKRVKDLFLFEDLCVSGGIVNAYQAIQAADQLP